MSTVAGIDIGKGNVNAGIQTAGYGPITNTLNKAIEDPEKLMKLATMLGGG